MNFIFEKIIGTVGKSGSSRKPHELETAGSNPVGAFARAILCNLFLYTTPHMRSGSSLNSR
jgi:hypothetical protein